VKVLLLTQVAPVDSVAPTSDDATQSFFIPSRLMAAICACWPLRAATLRAERAIRFGVVLRKVWGGSRTWAGARAQAVLMSVWRICWQPGRTALDFLSQLLRGAPVALALPP
jgi:transposase